MCQITKSHLFVVLIIFYWIRKGIQRGKTAYSKSPKEQELKVVLRPRPACKCPSISEPIVTILGKHKLKSILRPQGGQCSLHLILLEGSLLGDAFPKENQKYISVCMLSHLAVCKSLQPHGLWPKIK